MREDIVSDEPEIRDAMRAFDKAQQLLAVGRTASTVRVFGQTAVSWFGSEIDDRAGSLAYVRVDSLYEDLIGEVAQLSYGSSSLLVYVLGADDLPYDLHVHRNVFPRLDVLSREFIRCTVRAFA